jgi:hypothetical protein
MKMEIASMTKSMSIQGITAVFVTGIDEAYLEEVKEKAND